MRKVISVIKKLRIISLALVIAISLGGLGQIGTSVVAAGWLTGWSNRIQITINHTLINSNLTNFPVLIHLSSSSGTNSANVSAVFNTLGNNSQKIAVTTADGTTQCYVEIDSWDSTTKQADLWAKIPTISSSSDTILYLYYDNNQANNSTYVGPTDSTAAQKVWDNHFVSVYHLAQQGNGTAGEYKDSTSHGYNGQGEKTGSASYPVRTNGVVGGSYAQLFDGINNYPNGNFIKIPDENGFSQPTTGYLMISFWVDPTTLNFPTYNDAGQGYVRMFTKVASGNAEYHIRIYNDNSSVGAPPGDITAYVYSSSGGQGAGAALNKPGTINAGQWSYITVILDPTSITSRLNAPPYTAWGYNGGYTKRTVTYASMNVTPQNGTAPVVIGAGSSTSNDGFFSGKFSEIRFSNIDRGEAWIIASFYSERDGLLSFGTTETNSSNPPASQPPTVSTGSVSDLSTSGADISGSLNGLGSTTSVSVDFQYGPTASYGSSTAVQTMTTTGAFTADLTSLAPDTTYHYRAVAVGDGTAYGTDQTFTTTSNSTSSGGSSSTTATTGTFGLNSGNSIDHASLLNAQRFQNTVGTGTLTKLEVQVNDTSASGNLRLGVYADNNGSPGNLLLDAGSVPAANGWVGISGLNLPVTSGAYYWLAFLPQNSTGIEYQSTGMPANSHDDFRYTYGALPATCSIGQVNSTPFVMRATVSTTPVTTPPSITTGAATSITTNGVSLDGSLSSLGSASSVSVSFQYGPTASYGSSTAAQTMTTTGTFSANLTGLTAGTTYHYRAVAIGNDTTYGADQTFTAATNSIPPWVITNSSSYIGRSSATIDGSLTSMGTANSVSVSFEYGTTTSYGNSTTPQTMTGTGTFSANISGLASGTIYHYRTIAAINGLTVCGSDQTFTTNTKGKP